MLHVRTRRRLAAVIVIAAVGLSILTARIVRDRYSATGVHAAAERGLSQLLEGEVGLDALNFPHDGGLFFKWGSLSENGRQVMSFDGVTIESIPPPWKRWEIDEVGVSVISLEFDLGAPGRMLSHYEANLQSLLRVLERSVPPHSWVSLYDDYGDDVLPPGDEPVIWAQLSCAGRLYRYDVSKKRLLDEGVFELIPQERLQLDGLPSQRFQPEGWSFVIDSEKAILSSSTDSPGETLAKGLVAKGTTLFHGHLDFADAGTMRAVWDESGEAITFERQGGWGVAGSATKALGFETGTGTLTAQVDGFVIRDDKLMSLSGSLRYEVEAVSTRWLAAWLAAAGVAGLDAAELPESFRSVVVAADFEIADGVFSVKPAEGAPGLIWAEVNGDVIELVTARGSRPLDELLADARKIPPDEPPAEEAPAEEAPAEELPAEEAEALPDETPENR